MPRKIPTRAKPATPPSEPISRTPAKLSPIAIAVIVIVLLTAGGLMVKNHFSAPAAPASDFSASTGSSDSAQGSATANGTDYVSQLVAKVKTHILVKDGETPTVATIQDVNVLKKNNPAFYRDAQNGDSLLIWSDKAVIYSSDKDVVLAIMLSNSTSTVGTAPSVSATTTDSGSTASTVATSTASVTATSTVALPQVQVEVRNGSGIVGLAKGVATKLTALGLTVLPATNASIKTPYTTSHLIIKDGASADITSKIKENTGIQVVETALPTGEAAMKGDFLVIIGADYQK